MRRAAVLLALVLAAGCGEAVQAPRNADGPRIAGLGLAARLPSGWSGRIVLGANGRPVLHAASFPVPANDDDAGLEARSIIGSAGQAYVNVRDMGPGKATAELPLFAPSDFVRPVRGFETEASRDVSASGHVYRVTAVSGSRAQPSAEVVTNVNALVATLSLGPHELPPVPPAAGGKQLEGHGIALSLPPGWDGRVSHGLVDAAGAGLAMKLLEGAGGDVPFVTGQLPLRLSRSEFVPDSDDPARAVTGRSFVAAGRRLGLWITADSMPPTTAAVAEANAVLATLRVEPGDFYPGTVDPATFDPAPGWHTGTSGTAEVGPDAEATFSWASTVPYLDPANAFPPQRTLESLPPDGIAIVVWLARYHHWPSRLPAGKPPFRLGGAETGPFEGFPADRAAHRVQAHVAGGYDLTVWALFGRARPTDGQVDRAEAEIARLRLPDWDGG